MNILILILSALMTLDVRSVFCQMCFVTSATCPNPNVKFYLYTRQTQNSPVLLDVSKSSVGFSQFIPNRPVIVILHGYNGSYTVNPNDILRTAYFQNGEYNIISVDYSTLVPVPCYPTAVINIQTVGKCTAQLLDFLIANSITSLDAIHVIGFSLGAHTAGYVANSLTSGKLKRISGLEPAGPGFTGMPPSMRLDKDDAELVDCVHTDIYGRGTYANMGDIDFFVNGGYNQPGCMNTNDISMCSHFFAPTLFAESINSLVGFWGTQCSNTQQLFGTCLSSRLTSKLFGAYTPANSNGVYYFVTNSQSPYAKGNYY